MGTEWDLFGGVSSALTGGIPFFGLSHPDAIKPVDWNSQFSTQKYANGTSPEMLAARIRAMQMLEQPSADYKGQAAAAYAGPVASAAAKTGGVGAGGAAGGLAGPQARAGLAGAQENARTVQAGLGVKGSVDDWNLRQRALRESLLQRERAKLAREQAAKKAAAFNQQSANMENVAGNLEGMGGSMPGGGGKGGGGMGMLGGIMGGGGGGGMAGGGGGGAGGGASAAAIASMVLRQLAPSVKALGSSGNGWDEDYYGTGYGFGR